MARQSIPPDKQEDVDLQIAPMVNLMLVLIATFTVTLGSKIVEAELGVKVPGESKGEAKDAAIAPIKLSISKAGEVKFNGASISGPDDVEMEQLKSRLKNAVESNNKQPVIIIPDAETQHSRVIDAVNACAAAGVTNLSFSGG